MVVEGGFAVSTSQGERADRRQNGHMQSKNDLMENI